MVDVIVVGAGPVGLATAMGAAQHGMEVVVLDRRPGPIDKACGEGLMPTAIRCLNDLGVDVQGRAFRGIAYVDGAHRVEAEFEDRVGQGVRRTWLQEAMRERAENLGVHFVDASVERIEQSDGHVRAAGWKARYLVGADGLHSTVRSAVGIAASSPTPRRYGLRRHFDLEPWSNLVEVHWGAQSEAYVTPVSDSLIGVALLFHDRAGFDEHLAAFPALAERLHHAPAHGVLGAGPLRQDVAQRTSGRVALVGDAAGYVDAITGEGMATGMESARALAECLAADDLTPYEQRWRRATRNYRAMTSGLMWLRQRPRMGEQIVPVAHHAPWLFGAAVRALA